MSALRSLAYLYFWRHVAIGARIPPRPTPSVRLERVAGRSGRMPMELHENRTELERLLADVWDYEDGPRRKTSLPKWLFAVTLTGALLYTISPSDVVPPVTATFAPAAENTPVDKVSSENLDEDLDYRIAGQTKSLAGWRAFLEAHRDGPHAQAARAEIERLLPAPPEPAETAEQSPPSSAATQTPVEAEQSPAPAAPSPVTGESGSAQSPQLVQVAEQSSPSSAGAQTPVEAAQTPAPPAPPVTAEREPAASPQPVEAAEQSRPSTAATQATGEAPRSPAPPAPPVTAANEQAPPIPVVAPDTIAASPPLPPLRPREVAVAKSEEPTRHRHSRAEHRPAGQPSIFTILVAQLFHRHR